MNILALDLGTSLGFASQLGSGRVKLHQRLKPGLERTHRHGILCRRFHDWLCDELARTQAAVVVAECAGQHSNAGSQGAMRGVLLLVCDLREVLLDEVSPNAWQAWAKRQGGWVKGDEADAVYLRRYWLERCADRVRPAA